MENDKKLLYTCGDCNHQWVSTDYKADVTDEEADYHNGAVCPKCKSENVFGREI